MKYQFDTLLLIMSHFVSLFFFSKISARSWLFYLLNLQGLS